jgi:nicotinamide-nucleotide amidase
MSVKSAATLAVGTEVTEGQIIDRNSAWISHKLVEVGVQVIEHRAVADDHVEIDRALRDLSTRVDLLFVTGGLGPTSDDFTRDVLSKTFSLPLEYHEPSWQQVVDKLAARGINAREIQKQQCFFPKGSRVLSNPAGTANGFSFKFEISGHPVEVYALPGPPSEIAAIWEMGLAAEMQALTPESEREKLVIFRCLGRGESDIAELAEEAIMGSGLKVGYRAHMPYVEVKLWYRSGDRARIEPYLLKVEAVLTPWIVNREQEDVADGFLESVLRGQDMHVRDFATAGFFQERLSQRLRDRKLMDQVLPLTIETHHSPVPDARIPDPMLPGVRLITLLPDEAKNFWRILVKNGEGPESELAVQPAYNYKITSERGRKFLVEKALQLLGET